MVTYFHAQCLCSLHFISFTTISWLVSGKPKQYFAGCKPSAAFSLSICYTSRFYAILTHFTQIMSSEVQYCHPQLLIYTLCSQCEIISVNASSPLQPCLYHRPQLVSLALWSHHSQYNGTSAAPSWDFIHTHICLLCFSGPLLHAGFITTKLCMHQENKSAWTRWQERAHQRSHKMHKKNNIKEIWMKLCITGIFSPFLFCTHKPVSLPKWHPNIEIVQPAVATSVIQ